jgi:DNA polymerase III alpha subunit
MSFIHLHVKSWYSFRRGASSPDAHIQQALKNQQSAIAITDFMSTAGVIPMQVAAREAGLRCVVGAEVLVDGFPLVMLAATNAGFERINTWITRGFEVSESGVPFEEVR